MSLEIKLLVDGVTMHLLEPVSVSRQWTQGGGYPRVVDSSKYPAPILADSILDLDPVCSLV